MEENLDFEFFDSIKAEKNESSRAVRKEAAKKRSKVLKIVFFIIFAFLIIALAFLIYPLCSASYNPSLIAEKYGKSLSEKHYDEIYAASRFDESVFISKEAFDEYCSSVEGAFALSQAGISDYEVVFVYEDENGRLYYSVEFIDAGGKPGIYYFSLEKTENCFWLYDKYTVVPIEKGICSAVFYAPLSTEISVNGIKLENARRVNNKNVGSEGEYEYAEYYVGSIFAGNYKVKAENKYCKAYEESIDISADSNTFYIEPELKQETYDYVSKKVCETVELLYNSSGSVDKSSLPLTARFSENGFDDAFAYIQKSASAGSKNLSVSGVKINSRNLAEPAEGVKLDCSGPAAEISFEFEYEYDLKNKIENRTERRSASGSCAAKIVFNGSDWLIDDLALHTEF